MNKALMFLVMSMFLFSFVSAEYLPHEYNTTLVFSITSNFATNCTLTTINTPNDTITINQADTSSGTFTFSVLSGNYSSTGTYCHNIVCTDGTDTTTGQECREVTNNGNKEPSEFVVVAFIIAFLGVLYFMSSLIISNIGHWMQMDYDLSDLIKNISTYFVLVGLYLLETQYMGNQLIGEILVWIMGISGFTNVAMSFLAFTMCHLKRTMEQKEKDSEY
jgi:uncharacterized membrane protein